MDALEAIISRRSIRKYTPQPVHKDKIDTLLKAAMSAPSAGNEQPWHFVVIEDRKILDEIPKFHKFSRMLKEAPLAIVVCADSLLQKYGSIQWWVQDCSAATENILIAANALELGAVWLGMYPRRSRVENMKKLLGLPENITPLSLISIGYPEENKSPENRYNSTRVHKDKW